MEHNVAPTWETPDDHRALAELLAANRDLVEVNRQIAASLANLERLYSEDLHQRQKINRHTSAMMKRLNGNPLLSWPMILAVFVVPLIILMPHILRWFGN